MEKLIPLFKEIMDAIKYQNYINNIPLTTQLLSKTFGKQVKVITPKQLLDRVLNGTITDVGDDYIVCFLTITSSHILTMTLGVSTVMYHRDEFLSFPHDMEWYKMHKLIKNSAFFLNDKVCPICDEHSLHGVNCPTCTNYYCTPCFKKIETGKCPYCRNEPTPYMRVNVATRTTQIEIQSK